MKGNSFLLIVAFHFMGSCTWQGMDRAAYLEWAGPSNTSLHKTRSLGGYEFSVAYHPSALKALQGREGARDEGFGERRSFYGQMSYFTVTVSLPDGAGGQLNLMDHLSQGSPVQRQQVSYYLSYTLQHQIHLKVGDTSLTPSLFNFEKAYGLGGQARFSMAFDHPDQAFLAEGGQLLIDADRLGCGSVNIRFKPIQHPEIKI